MHPVRRVPPAHALVVAVALLALGTPQGAQGQMAVIVNVASPVDEATTEEVRRWFRGQVIAFADGTRIQLVQNGEVRDDFYRSLLDWSARQFKKHWIGVVFSGAEGAPPLELDQRDALAFVARDRRAISFVRAQDVDESVRALRIDGLWPGDPGYPLR